MAEAAPLRHHRSVTPVLIPLVGNVDNYSRSPITANLPEPSMILPNAQPSTAPPTEPDRRCHQRYTVQVQIEVRQEGVDVPLRLVTTDLSRGGCYVQMLIQLPLATRVRVTLWLDGCPVIIRGVIVTRHPQFGNGIMFLEIEGEGEKTLQRYLDAIVTD